MMPPLRPYQERAKKFVLYKGASYLMMDMGLGKTRVCIDASKELPYPMFILAPRFAALNDWPNELYKWESSRRYMVLHGPKKEERWAKSYGKHIILNYDGLKWFYEIANKGLRKLEKFYMVFDEASMVKSQHTKRFDMLHDMQPIMSPYRTALSGTPAPNTLDDLWSQYYLLDSGKTLNSSYYSFRNRYFHYSGPNGSPPFQTTLKHGAADKIAKAIAPITLRMDSEDYLQLPEVTHNDIVLELPPGLRSKYDYLEKEFMLEFPTGTAIARSSAVLSAKLRQFLQGAIYLQPEVSASGHMKRQVEHLHKVKAQALKQLLTTSAGQSIFAATAFRFEHEIYCKELGYDIPRIDGTTSSAKGLELIRQWNRGELPLLLAHPRSVAHGLNLQTGGHQALFLGLPWELDLYQQFIKRLHRSGQRSDRVVVHRMMFKNTVDEKVARYLARKGATQQGLFDAIAGR